MKLRKSTVSQTSVLSAYIVRYVYIPKFMNSNHKGFFKNKWILAWVKKMMQSILGPLSLVLGLRSIQHLHILVPL